MDEPQELSGLPRPDGPSLDPLLTWALGAFHTAFFVFVLVFLLYRADLVGELLGGLNTLAGSGVYALFWLTTGWFTRRAVRGMGEAVFRALPPTRQFILRGLVWGGANGVAFLAVVSVSAYLAQVASQPQNEGMVPASALGVGLFASPVAFLVGAVVGLSLSTVDTLLLFLALRLLPGQAPSQR